MIEKHATSQNSIEAGYVDEKLIQNVIVLILQLYNYVLVSYSTLNTIPFPNNVFLGSSM